MPTGACYHGHAVVYRRPGMVRSLIVVTRRRAEAPRDPVNHDRGQQIVPREAGFDLAAAAVRAGIAEGDDYFPVLPERSGPAVQKDQRLGTGALART